MTRHLEMNQRSSQQSTVLTAVPGEDAMDTSFDLASDTDNVMERIEEIMARLKAIADNPDVSETFGSAGKIWRVCQ